MQIYNFHSKYQLKSTEALYQRLDNGFVSLFYKRNKSLIYMQNIKS